MKENTVRGCTSPRANCADGQLDVEEFIRVMKANQIALSDFLEQYLRDNPQEIGGASLAIARVIVRMEAALPQQEGEDRTHHSRQDAPC